MTECQMGSAIVKKNLGLNLNPNLNFFFKKTKKDDCPFCFESVPLNLWLTLSFYLDIRLHYWQHHAAVSLFFFHSECKINIFKGVMPFTHIRRWRCCTLVFLTTFARCPASWASGRSPPAGGGWGGPPRRPRCRRGLAPRRRPCPSSPVPWSRPPADDGTGQTFSGAASALQ